MINRVVTIILILIVSACWGEIRYVQPGEVIQDAVNVSTDGDTLIIEDGLYEQTTILYGKDLVIGSRFLLDGDTSHIAGTVISGTEQASDTLSCFVYAYGEGEAGRLVGLTMRDSGGTYWEFGEEYAGGAVYLILSTVTIENCAFRSTSSYVGGAVASCFTRHVRETRLTLRDCVFDSCSCDSWGGAVYANFAFVTMTGCSFNACESFLFGSGAIFLDCEVVIDSCSLVHCRSTHADIALYIGGCEGYLTNSVLRENFFNEEYGIAHLGINGSFFSVSGCYIADTQGGMSVHLSDTRGGHTNFIGNVIENNTSANVTGTLLYWDGVGDIAYNVFRNNDNFLGGTIQTYGHNRSRIHHNVFDGNLCPVNDKGSVINNLPDSQPTLDSNIFRNNSAPAIVHWSMDTDSLDARNNWWGDPSGPYHPTLNPSGMGDTLYSDSILFIPWLTIPPDTVLPESTRESPSLVSTWELISIYPNPFNSEVSLEFAGFTGTGFKITLHNLLGQTVDNVYSGSLAGGKVHYIASPTLATGVYFLCAYDGVQMQTRKVVFLK